MEHIKTKILKQVIYQDGSYDCFDKIVYDEDGIGVDAYRNHVWSFIPYTSIKKITNFTDYTV